MSDKEHEPRVTTGGSIDRMAQGLIIGEKKNTLAAHAPTPYENAQQDREKFQNSEIETLPTVRPSTIKRLGTSDGTKTKGP